MIQPDSSENETVGGEQLPDDGDIRACGVDTAHARHSWAIPGTRRLDGTQQLATCPGVEPVDQAGDALGSYADMFAEYLTAQRHWIGPAQQPLVFHIRKLCARLDSDPDAPASYASAYLQAISRLDKQRPGNKQPAGSDGDLPGQGSIFDELD